MFDARVRSVASGRYTPLTTRARAIGAERRIPISRVRRDAVTDRTVEAYRGQRQSASTLNTHTTKAESC